MMLETLIFQKMPKYAGKWPKMARNGTLGELRVQNNFQNRISCSEQVARVSGQLLMALARQIEKRFELSENYSIKKCIISLILKGYFQPSPAFRRKYDMGRRTGC